MTPQIFGLFSFLGLLDAAYLTFEHFLGRIPACNIAGCESVLTSRWATIGGIPLALLGAFYYLTLLLLAVFYLDQGKKPALKLAANLTWIGFVISIGLIYLQVAVIGSLCLYCLISAAISTILFLLGRRIKVLID